MPVEIRELVIKATVSHEGNASGKAPAASGANNTQEIIKVCVEKVLEIIKDRHGR